MSFLKNFTQRIKSGTHYIESHVKQVNDHLSSLKKQKNKELRDIEKMEKKIKTLAKEDKKDQEAFKVVAINGKTSLTFWLVWALVAYLSYIFFQWLSFIYLIVTAFILSIAVESIIVFLAKRMHRWLAIGISYLILIAFALGWILFIVPFMLQQLTDIISIFVDKLYWLQTTLNAHGIQSFITSQSYLPWFIKESLTEFLADGEIVAKMQWWLQENISQIVSAWSDYATTVGNVAVNFVSSLVNTIINAWLVITMSVLFSIEKHSVVWFLAGLWWHHKKPYRTMKLEKLYRKLWYRLRSQLFLGIYIGIMVYICLWILALFGINLPSKWTLALISWFTEFIPYLWPILWSIPAVMVALASFGLKGWIVVTVVYLAIQWTENNILIPLLMNKTLWVSPVVIFISMLIGGITLWFVWVLFAVPLAVIVTLLFDDDFE